MNPDVIKLQAEIQSLTVEAEAAGEEGDIDKAQVCLITKEQLLTNIKIADVGNHDEGR